MKTCFDHNFSKSANPDILQKPLIVARFPLFEYAFTTTRAHERAEKSKLSARPKNAAAPSLLVIFSIEPLRIKKKKENLLYTVCTFLLLISTFSAQLGHDSSTLQGVHGKISETTFPADFAELWSKQVFTCFINKNHRKKSKFSHVRPSLIKKLNPKKKAAHAHVSRSHLQTFWREFFMGTWTHSFFCQVIFRYFPVVILRFFAFAVFCDGVAFRFFHACDFVFFCDFR